MAESTNTPPTDQLELQQTPRESKKPVERRLKLYVNWAFFIGAAISSVFHAGFVMWKAFTGDEYLMKMVYEHYAAIVGLPYVGFAALGLVLLLESRSDQPIEFKGAGFEFKGASAPIVLWVLCFLAMVVCLKLLW